MQLNKRGSLFTESVPTVTSPDNLKPRNVVMTGRGTGSVLYHWWTWNHPSGERLNLDSCIMNAALGFCVTVTLLK